MRGFWFRETSQLVIKGSFYGLVGAEFVGSSGNRSDLGVEAFVGASGDFSLCPKPMEEQRLMGTQYAGYPFHWFQGAAPGPGAAIVEKGPGPDHGLVEPVDRPFMIGICQLTQAERCFRWLNSLYWLLTLWVNLDQGLVVAQPQQYESLCCSNERLAAAFRIKNRGQEPMRQGLYRMSGNRH
jgi:hypothetical protein